MQGTLLVFLAVYAATNLKSYQDELANQIKLLKSYIGLCCGKPGDKKMHPSFITEILNSNFETATKIHEYHLDLKVYHQSFEFASLGSTIQYFAKVFYERKDVYKIIKQEVDLCNLVASTLKFPANVLAKKRPRITSNNSENQGDEPEESTSKKTIRPICSFSKDFVFDSDAS